jgi:ABC-type multidrug transport system fused ATPase/permease subunit
MLRLKKKTKQSFSRNKKNLKMNFVQKVWKLLKPFHKTLYLILAITLVFEIIRQGGPWIFGKILDLLVQTGGNLTVENALLIVAGLAGVRLLTLFIDYSRDLVIELMLLKEHHHIATTAFSKLLELSLDYHEKVNTGNKINVVNRGADKLVELTGYLTFEFLPTILQLVTSVGLILIVSWRFGIIFGLSLVPFILITFWVARSNSKLRSQRHDAYETSSGEIGDTITNITVVKAFAQENREEESFQSIWSLIRTVSLKEYRRMIGFGFGRSLLVEIFYITLMIIGVIEVQHGALTVGSLVFLITLTERAYSNVYRLGRVYNRIVDAMEPVDRITNLMAERQSIKNSKDAIKPDKINGSIEFKNVDFGYGKSLVLNDVSFTIPAGSFTALVGKSGSGKSTIAKLLSRYYDPVSGSIVIDQKYNLKQLDLDYYRKETAVVFQDSPVPNRKVWEVIAYAAGRTNWHVVKERVIHAAQLASAHEFIEEFSEGYQTQVGERGVKLSGGQKQRLAIARALFADPKILIMDEPTSHLDTLSEAMIQQALENISKERTLTKIVIAHRLSTVQHADQILVMHKGRLAEQGTHVELLKKGGIYAQIVAQSELKS